MNVEFYARLMCDDAYSLIIARFEVLEYAAIIINKYSEQIDL